MPLPGDKGFVELTIPADAAKPGKSRSKPRIFVYFYQLDAKTEMNPGPNNVTIKVGTGTNSPVLKLAPPTNGDGKYASEPGVFPDGFRGEISATIGGEAVQVPFIIR